MKGAHLRKIRSFHRTQVAYYTKLGLSTGEVAAAVGISESTVRYLKIQLKTSGCFKPVQATKPHIKVTPEIMNYVDSRTFANPNLSGNALVQEIQQQFGIELCRRTVDNIRIKLKFNWLHRVRIFDLTALHIEKRFDFVQYHINEDTSWDNVLFTDESYMEVGLETTMCWRRRGDTRDEVLCHLNAHPTKIMIWAGIAKNFKSELIMFEPGETMNSNTYIQKVWEETSTINTLNQKFGEFEWLLMQDNATCHVSKITMDYLRNKVLLLEGWPPHSPDLNVIEMIWCWIKNRIAERSPKSLDALKQCITDVWDHLSMYHVNNLIESMQRRIYAVYNSNGGQIIGHLK
jgi:transposase